MDTTTLGTSTGVRSLQFVLIIAGCWPKKLPYWLSALYSVYSLVILVTFLFLYTLSMTIYIFFITNVEEATNNLCMTLTLMTLFGKVMNFKIFLPKIQNLLHFGEEFKLENDEEVQSVEESISFYNKLINLMYVTANIAGSFAYIGTFLSHERRLPFLAWFPFDWKSNHTTYVLLYVYQCIGMLLQCNLNITMDLFSAYLMHIAAIKLQILGKRLQKLSEFPLHGTLNLNMDDKAKRRHLSSLVRCIKNYQRIWKYMQQLQQYFTYGFFIQISFSGVVICFIAFQLTSTSPQEEFALYMFMILFGICMITQMGLPCYFGNEIILKHEALRGCAFESGWYLQSPEYRKNLTIFMELVKEKRSILVGNWFDLDLNLFSSIMNFAYRLYAVLV